MTNIYIDENMPSKLAEGLDILQGAFTEESIRVISIKTKFGQGVKDEDWIPAVGNEKSVVITQDLNIQRTRQLKLLYENHGVGVFFFKPPSKRGYTYWDMVTKIISMWIELKKHTMECERPFAFRCTSRSTHFEKL